MATVTGFTAARMQAIEDGTVTEGFVDNGVLMLKRHDGSVISAGSVRGPQGPIGEPGALQFTNITDLVNYRSDYPGQLAVLYNSGFGYDPLIFHCPLNDSLDWNLITRFISFSSIANFKTWVNYSNNYDLITDIKVYSISDKITYTFNHVSDMTGKSNTQIIANTGVTIYPQSYYKISDDVLYVSMQGTLAATLNPDLSGIKISDNLAIPEESQTSVISAQGWAQTFPGGLFVPCLVEITTMGTTIYASVNGAFRIFDVQASFNIGPNSTV